MTRENFPPGAVIVQDNQGVGRQRLEIRKIQISLGRLFLERLPLFQLLGVREGDSVDALQ